MKKSTNVLSKIVGMFTFTEEKQKLKEKENKKLKTITEDKKTECFCWKETFENDSAEEKNDTEITFYFFIFFEQMKTMDNENFVIYSRT